MSRRAIEYELRGLNRRIRWLSCLVKSTDDYDGYRHQLNGLAERKRQLGAAIK